MAISHTDLYSIFRKGLRNGNWRRLTRIEKAFYRAALWYSKFHGKLVNALVVEELSLLIEKLKETPGIRIFKKGFEMAVQLLEKYEKSGVLLWAPLLREWLKDPDYITWLGTT